MLSIVELQLVHKGKCYFDTVSNIDQLSATNSVIPSNPVTSKTVFMCWASYSILDMFLLENIGWTERKSKWEWGGGGETKNKGFCILNLDAEIEKTASKLKHNSHICNNLKYKTKLFIMIFVYFEKWFWLYVFTIYTIQIFA